MKGLHVITEESGFAFDKVADAAYKRLGQKEDLAVEISFVDGEEIRRINREFRNADRTTDVLSFPYLENVRYKTITKKDFPCETDEEGRLLIGSVCICPERAKEQAEEYGHSLEREVLYLALHGILHCFGYDHETEEDEEEMTSLAEEIMTSVGVTRGA